MNYFQAVSQVHRSVYQNFVVANLPFEGADAATAFPDEKGHTFTANGNAQIDTAQFKFGVSSGFFDGAGDFISTPDSDDWNVAAGNMDLRCFILFGAVGATFQVICGQAASGLSSTSITFSMQKTDANKFRFMANSGAATVIDIVGSTTLTTGVWYHARLRRTGSTFDLIVSGAVEASGTSAGTLNNSTSVFSIGRWGAHNDFYVNGWIDDFVLIKGAADPCNDAPTLPFPKF